MLMGYVDAEEAGCPYGRIRYRYSENTGPGYVMVNYGLRIGRRFIIRVDRVVLQDHPVVWMSFLGDMVERSFGFRQDWSISRNLIEVLGYEPAEQMRVENFLGEGVRFHASNNGVVDLKEVRIVDFTPLKRMSLKELAQEATYNGPWKPRLLEELRRRTAC